MAQFYEYDHFKNSTAKKIPLFMESEGTLDSSKVMRSLDLLLNMYAKSQEAFDLKMQKHIEQKKLLEKKFNIEIQKQAERNNILESENATLKATVRHLENVLKRSIPTHIILFMIINTIIMTFSITMAILYYSMQLTIFDIYYVWCTIIISVTLFCTALRSLVDWRQMLNGPW